jgi:hypothetical protein
MNGWIEGCTDGLQTWEDALTVTFPKLMAGAIQRQFNYSPIGAGIAPKPAGQDEPGSDHAEGSAAGIAVPNGLAYCFVLFGT